jgi:hypothetical protein
MLYDNFTDAKTNVSSSSYVLGLYNRGNYGSGHGWAAVHSVAWNCNTGASRIILQKPPTAQNYAIGCVGGVTGAGPFSGPQGYIEGTNTAGLQPRSLYVAQLADRLQSPTDVGTAEEAPGQAKEFRLEQNFPNPFNPTTTICYQVSRPGTVTLKVFDVLGREACSLVNERLGQGTYRVRWNAQHVPSGVYVFRLEADGHVVSKKMTLIK